MHNVRKNKLGWNLDVIRTLIFAKISNFHSSTEQTTKPVKLQTLNSIASKIVKSRSKFFYQILLLL